MKIHLKLIAVLLTVSVSSTQAGMVEQVLYNVVGQASNALGARIGDEIYYGSSRGHHRRVKHRKKRHKVKHKAKHKKVMPIVMTDEKKIQKALKSLGFYKGSIDGEINSYETRSAIKAMNVAYGLGNNAFLAPQVKDSLIYLGNLFAFDRALIANGSDKKTKGKKIQTALKILGYYNSKIDGLVGSGTRKCIANYKSDNGIGSSGTLDFEEEYRLISLAQEKNSKNMDETIAAIKSFAKARQVQPTVNTMQRQSTTITAPVQPANRVVVQQPVAVQPQAMPQSSVAPAGQQVVRSGQQVMQKQQPQQRSSTQMNVAQNLSNQPATVNSRVNIPQRVVQQPTLQETQNTVQQSVAPKSNTTVPSQQVGVQSIPDNKEGINPTKQIPTVNTDLTKKIVQNSN